MMMSQAAPDQAPSCGFGYRAAMTFGRPLRRWLSACTVLALLLVQFASLAHACPLLAATDLQSPAAKAMPCADTMAQASDPVPKDLPVICVKHCQPEPQGVNASVGPMLSPPLVMSMLPLAATDESTADAPDRRATDAAPRATPPPPLSILNCCWRI